MTRGTEPEAIFRYVQSRKGFLRRLALLLLDNQTQCYARVLLKNQNHAHLLLRSGLTGFSQLMRRLLIGGGLIRSLGGCKALKKIGLKGQDRLKSDARSLGDSDFVTPDSSARPMRNRIVIMNY